MLKCCLCGATAQFGALCADCQIELVGTDPLTQEQIRACHEPTSAAALVDVWGGAHRLSVDTLIGRTGDPATFEILSPLVSRRHARVSLVDRSWQAIDLGSRNGTFVDDQAADVAIRLRTGSRLAIGTFAFYFVEDARMLSAPRSKAGQTAPPNKPLGITLGRLRTEPLAATLPMVTLAFVQPTGGDIGVVEVDGRRVQLSLPQFELVRHLHDRMLADAHVPQHARGFTSVRELAKLLPLDSSSPADDNVRQLVHRVRIACRRAQVAQLVESRYGRGYRLAVVPALTR